MNERKDVTERIERDKERYRSAMLNELEEELLKALRYVIVARKIKCSHKWPGPDDICARCIADAVIAKAEKVRKYASRID